MQLRSVRSCGIALALSALACGSEPTSPTASPTFAEPALYSAGATALVNLTALKVVGDARQDLLAVARSDGSVRMLPGLAGGSFGAAVTLAPGNDPHDATAGDVNGDGIPDLLVTGQSNNFIVWLGRPDGSFGAPATYPLGNHGRVLAVADLNADGFDDVVAVHDGSGNPIYVAAYLGTATGELQKVWELGTPYFTSMGIATGDFDGDGKTDVAVAAGDLRASALVFRGLGTGAFEAPVIVPNVSPDPNRTDGTRAIAVGDLNRDGRDDIVLACFEFSNQLVVRLATASGFSEPHMVALPSPVAVALGDVNGDGILDAVASNLEQGTLSLVWGRGDGSFSAPVTVVAGPEPTSLTMGDFNGDGLADVAVTDLIDNEIRVFLARAK